MHPESTNYANIEIGDLVLKHIKYPTTKYNQDIIPGVYEGGLQIWECTLDFLKYIQKHQQW